MDHRDEREIQTLMCFCVFHLHSVIYINASNYYFFSFEVMLQLLLCYNHIDVKCLQVGGLVPKPQQDVVERDTNN